MGASDTTLGYATYDGSLGAKCDPSDQSLYSFTGLTQPSIARLVIVDVFNARAAGPTVTIPTISGMGITWGAPKGTILDDPGSGARLRGTRFAAFTTAPAGTQIDVDFGGEVQLCCAINIRQWAGVDSADPIVQTVVNHGFDNNYSFSLAAPTMMVDSGSAHLANEDVTPGASWTEANQISCNGPDITAEGEYLLAGAPAASWPTVSSWVAFGSELRDAASVGGGVFFDETGRALTLKAPITAADIQAMLESGKVVTLKAQFGESDQAISGIFETGLQAAAVLVQIGQSSNLAAVDLQHVLTLDALNVGGSQQASLESSGITLAALINAVDGMNRGFVVLRASRLPEKIKGSRLEV